jgi:hypothetical protein
MLQTRLKGAQSGRFVGSVGYVLFEKAISGLNWKIISQLNFPNAPIGVSFYWNCIPDG